MSNLTYQFRSKSILSFYKKEAKGKSSFRSAAKQRSIENLIKQEPYSGRVTDGSQKRLTRAIENLLQVAQPKWFTFDGREYMFRVNFITLTLYSFGRRVPAKEAHKTCLEPFLRWMRVKGMTAYVWKAELQTKRKDCQQLHYHITTDVYVDYLEIRNKWNDLQRRAGYLDSFFDKFGHWNANSTDVHATHNKRNLTAYLKKKIVRYSDKKQYEHLRNKYLVRAEMAKADQNELNLEGKVWDCSLNLKVAYYEVKDFYDVTSEIAKAVNLGQIERKEFNQCTVYQLKYQNANPYDYLPALERHFYHEHIRKMREFERVKPDISVFSSS